jgi:hypothetical protein
MEDEVFEKYKDRITAIFNEWGEYADFNPCGLKRKFNCFGEVKLKQILEEIWQDGYNTCDEVKILH